jgi:hypothetical protein
VSPLLAAPRLIEELVRSTVAELRALLSDGSPLAAFLLERFAGYRGRGKAGAVWSKEIRDLAATARLACPGGVTADLVYSPVLSGSDRGASSWGRDPGRHLGAKARHVDRDAVLDSFLDGLDAVSD